ncbi:hypothetical protein IQ215_08000 [Cyanobacterium stanieri LEGE 03274]|uniref:Uncharacterized protein n=1 Tax=Cyanobacterium stanieri LEGE 03274 TaxID=1828756 RepID=A0ABR9V508_9CHRO|nr:hypothetical protein [Cyanobacterium stanieri]MBE9222639.1 hypothetical protein [Cyanobacterium stanieri LEGE 03274]
MMNFANLILTEYELVIYCCEIDNYFVVEVAELSEFLADGKTHQEMVINAEINIQE